MNPMKSLRASARHLSDGEIEFCINVNGVVVVLQLVGSFWDLHEMAYTWMELAFDIVGFTWAVCCTAVLLRELRRRVKWH